MHHNDMVQLRIFCKRIIPPANLLAQIISLSLTFPSMINLWINFNKFAKQDKLKQKLPRCSGCKLMFDVHAARFNLNTPVHQLLKAAVHWELLIMSTKGLPTDRVCFSHKKNVNAPCCTLSHLSSDATQTSWQPTLDVNMVGRHSRV